jgi:hypothetical protein
MEKLWADVFELVDQGMSNFRISKELGVSRSTIVRIKSKLSISSKFYDSKRETVKCENCNKEFKCIVSDGRKFCSRRCSAINVNRTRVKWRLKCVVCDSEIIGKGNVKYCSKNCNDLHKEELRNLIIVSGNGSSRSIKKYLIKTHGNKCMDCGWCQINLTTGKVPIEIEHIDGNSENNDLSNLKLLCPNCHSLTPTYKSLNRGKGRHSRMVRYNEDKSY